MTTNLPLKQGITIANEVFDAAIKLCVLVRDQTDRRIKAIHPDYYDRPNAQFQFGRLDGIKSVQEQIEQLKNDFANQPLMNVGG